MTLHVLCPLRIEARAARSGSTTARVELTGFGPKRSCEAAARLSLDETSAVAVLGFGGALTDDVQPGDLIVATEVRGPAGTQPVPAAQLVASELARAGLSVRLGPVVSTDHAVTGSERAALAQAGGLGVDMESAWLAGATMDRPTVVVRAVVDTPSHELRSPKTVLSSLKAYRALRAAVPVLERWAAAAGPRHVLLAGPRSFCAGVVRAIDVVERAIERYGTPVYVRRQIVHNSSVVRDLERQGAVFVEELDEVPAGARVVLAAHGVAPAVKEDASDRELAVIDATCPLVAKVHTEARRFAKEGYSIVLIGHDDHEEIHGTIGEAPEHIQVVDPEGDAEQVLVHDPERVAFLTQTTLATDEVSTMVDRLRASYPALVGPRSDDICYATQNRQDAVRAIAPDCDVVLVVGSSNSSNSQRLTEVSARAGCPAHLVDGPHEVQLDWIAGASTVGVTAGASAPESLVQAVVDWLSTLGPVEVAERSVVEESVQFTLPVEVR